MQVKLKILDDQIGALSHEGAGQEEVWFCGLTLGNVYCSKQSLLEVVITSLLPESQSTNKKYDVKHEVMMTCDDVKYEVMMSNSWLAYNVSSLFRRLLGA